MENRFSSSGIGSQDLLHWRSSRRSQKTWQIETLNLKILEIGSSSCQCSMTSIGGREDIQKDISNSEQVKNYAERFSRGHWTFLGPGDEKEVVRNCQLHTWRKMGVHRHTHGGTIQRNWSPSIQEHQCFESSNSAMKRWRWHHTLQWGLMEHRTLVSHHSLSNSAQYQRSSLELVWRIRSKKGQNQRSEFGKVRGKRKWAVVEKCEAARSEFFGANSKER